MQPIPQELLRVLSSRLKLGEMAKPVCRVEVDRLAFVPGATEELEFVLQDWKTIKEVVKYYITESTDTAGNKVYGGETITETTSMVFPVAGYTFVNIGDRFGTRNGAHKGVDIPAPTGTAVMASWGGTVVFVNRNPASTAGMYACILHANGVMTRYLHLSKVLVEVGQQVSAGNQIGEVGNTGDSTGSHLHFEIRTGVNSYPTNSKAGTPIDPYPYLSGSTAMYTASKPSGTGVVDEGTIKGYPGEVRLFESFAKRNWMDDTTKYTTDFSFKQYSRPSKMPTLLGGVDGVHIFEFPKETRQNQTVVGFNIKTKMNNPGTLKIGVASNFVEADRDELQVHVNGKLRGRFLKFKGETNVQDLEVPIPDVGDVDIRISVMWGGKVTPVVGGGYSYQIPRNLIMTYLRLQEVNQTASNLKSPDQLNPITAEAPVIDGFPQGHWETQELERFIFNEKTEKVYLEVGRFVYMDTLTLPNVVSLEIDDQFDSDAREARVVLSNPNGYFSPDFNPYYFPEVGIYETPYSYWVNGFRVGVLSDNTPIRIYIGYGQNLMRVFTGLIDKVDMTGEDSSMTISCRDMYKKIIETVLRKEKKYPDEEVGHGDSSSMSGVLWVKSAVVQDLIAEAGMYGWRQTEEDLWYPDSVIDETYIIQAVQATGKVIRAIPNQEGQFEMIDAASVPTPFGWENPFVEEEGKAFAAFKYKVSEALSEVIRDLPFRSYCDRYGTYRFEKIRYFKPVVAEFTEYDNLISINKSVDWSRGRSHVVVVDADKKYGNFIDKEILMELKGEIRTTVIEVPWAKSEEAKREVAERAFFDMKRLCRSLQVSIPGNPALELLDRVLVTNKHTATRSVYTIKGIRSTFSVDAGYLQVVDMMWASEGMVV